MSPLVTAKIEDPFGNVEAADNASSLSIGPIEDASGAKLECASIESWNLPSRSMKFV